MASLPRTIGSQFFLLTRQTTITSTWHSCSPTPPTRFLFHTNGPITTTIRSRLLHSTRRVKPSSNPVRPAPRRNASSSSTTKAKKAPAITITPKPPLSSTSPSSKITPNALLKSYVERLASKGSRTLLYEAPSHFWYRVSSFAAGAFCITYTVVQYWEVYLHPREGLAAWVPHAFGVICIFMTAMGLYFILGTKHIVRHIEAVPTSLLTAAKKLPPAAQQKSPIYIEVAMQRAFPFLPMKRRLLLPEEIQLPFRMFGVLGNQSILVGEGKVPPSPKNNTMVELVRAEREAREAKAREIQFRRDHILTSPFRDGAKVGKQVAGGVWASIKRPFFREGFAKILVGKAEYKLDISGGWALEDGKVLDRLFVVRPAPGS